MSTMRCKCRRQAETGLRCVRCNIPICPDCSRSAPVGFLCRTCADGKRTSHLYQVDARGLLLGYLGSLAIALFGGWIMADYGMRIGFFGCFLAFVYGNIVAEAGLRITGRKRGLAIEIMAGISTLLGLVGGELIYISLNPHFFSEVSDAAPGAMTYLQSELIHPLNYLVLAIAIVGAVSRIRSI